MKLIFLIQLFLISFNSNSQTLRQLLLKQNPNVEGIIINKCKIDSELFIVTIQKQIDWWEDINIIKFKNGKILWTAKFDKLPTSPSIDKARQISLSGYANPLIEIFDVTHMGNGFYYLYELKGKNLKQLICTIAIDDNDDGATYIKHEDCSRFIKNRGLKPIYQDINKDGVTDVRLTGKIQIVCNDFKKEYYAQKVFLYNKPKNKFIENSKLRKGFKLIDD